MFAVSNYCFGDILTLFILMLSHLVHFQTRIASLSLIIKLVESVIKLFAGSNRFDVRSSNDVTQL